MKKRVVVTGIGIISSCGINVEETWNSLLKGQCSFVKSKYSQVNFYGEVDSKYNDLLSKKEIRYMDKTSHFALLAAREAVKDCRIEDLQGEETIVSIGSVLGGMETFTTEISESAKDGMDKITVRGMIKALSNMIGSNISIEFGIKGGAYTYNSACASSSIAIGEAYRKIQYGEAKIALAGGAESCIVEQVIESFSRLNTLSQSDDIKKASIPFSKDRTGFVMGEGAAILVLEEYEHAVKRGANIYCEIIGYGVSSDAKSLVAPDLEGIKLCLNRALSDADLRKEDIGYINAHGTGTLANDVTEGMAINQIFDNKPYVASTKSMHGHLLGATGALEASICCLMIKNKILLPQVNVAEDDIDEEIKGINLLTDHSVEYNDKAIMSNSFGFGGDNASLIFAKI